MRFIDLVYVVTSPIAAIVHLVMVLAFTPIHLMIELILALQRLYCKVFAEYLNWEGFDWVRFDGMPFSEWFRRQQMHIRDEKLESNDNPNDEESAAE